MDSGARAGRSRRPVCRSDKWHTSPRVAALSAWAGEDTRSDRALRARRRAEPRRGVALPPLRSPDMTRCTRLTRCTALLLPALLAGCSTTGTKTDTHAASAPASLVQASTAQPAKASGESEPATTNVARVTFAEEGADFDPCVSRDGTRLVFASTQHRETSDIYVKRTDSRVVTQLTNDPAEDSMPSISPDGQWVAFASNRSGNWDVYVMPITGAKAVQVTSDAADEIHPSWSPDGKRLVFCRAGEASGRWEMWVTELSNSAVASFIGFGLFPQWSPIAATGVDASDKILFQLSRERGKRSFGLWTIDYANGSASNATQIASSAETALINPTWSPDGRWVVYAEIPADEADLDPKVRPSSATLWMVSLEGEARVRLTTGSEVNLAPAWGGNNRLFYVSDRTGKDNIWSLDLTPAIRAAQAAAPSAIRTAARP